MSQLNLILYILGSDWYFRRKLQWLMLKLHMYEKKVFSLKEGAVKNGDINWRGMGLLSYPILSTLSSNLILSYLTLKCSRWQDDWNWREVAATAGLHHFSKGARGKFKESWIQIQINQKFANCSKIDFVLWKWYFIRTPSQQIKMRILIWTIKCQWQYKTETLFHNARSYVILLTNINSPHVNQFNFENSD